VTHTVDDSIFNDKELIRRRQQPSSPHYGRIYVTYTKFHLLPNGFSDYCAAPALVHGHRPDHEPLAVHVVRTRRFSPTNRVATVRLLRQPVQRSRSRETAHVGRWVRLRELQRRVSTRIALPEVRPTEARPSWRARCRSTRRVSTWTSWTPPVTTPCRQRTSGAEHHDPGLQSEDRTLLVRLPEQHQPGGLPGRHLLPDFN